MANDKTLYKKRLLLPLLSFGSTILAAIILLMTALVIWLTELIGSASLAALILACGFLAVSWIIYSIWTRDVVEYIDNKLNTIYDVAYTARSGYEALRSFAVKLFSSLVKHP